jgi:LPXTG-motif cell wall-anchored protein
MGVNFTKLLKKSTKSIKKHPYLAILGLGLGMLGSGYFLMKKRGSIFDITL